MVKVLSNHLSRIPYVSSFILQAAASVLGLAVPIYAYRLGASSLIIGFIGTSGGVTYALTAVISGRLCDRRSGKTVLLFASAVLTTVALVYSLVEDYVLLVPLTAVHYFALGVFWPGLEGFIVRQASSLGTHVVLRNFNVSWSVGWIVGPPLGGFLIGYFPSAYVFYASSVLCLIGFVFLSTLQKDSPLPTQHSIGGKTTGQACLCLQVFAMFYGLTFVYAFTTQIQSNLFPAFAMSLGEDPTVVGGIVLFVGVARTVVFCLSGIIERSSKRPLVFVGPTLIAIAMGLIFIGQKPWHFALACFILGLGSGISYFLSLSTVLGKANFALGLRAGLFESMIGTGSALGPFLGGLVSAVNPRYPYALSGLVCILVMLYLFGKTIKSEKKN